jgi:O-antigen/teichoic acid export membrane protein
MLRFGWPLLVNGFLMFAVTQGDQSLVASFYSLVDLGAFSAAATLALVPTFLFGKVSTSLLLPILANAQNDPILFERRYRQAVHSQCAFAAVCATAMVLGADSLMRIVYGQKYTGNSELLAFLAISTAFRNIRIAPSLAALAKGDSNNQLISNMWRLCGLPFSLVIAWKQCPMYLITVSAICGEIVAALVSFWRLQKRDGISIWISLLPLLWVGAVSLAGSSLLTVIKHMSLPVTILIAALCSLVVGFLTLLMFPPVRPHFTSLITRCLPHV